MENELASLRAEYNKQSAGWAAASLLRLKQSYQGDKAGKLGTGLADKKVRDQNTNHIH